MRVLWFTNSSSCYKRSSGNYYNGGGWISSLETELKKRKDIELGVCFYTNSVPEQKKEKQEDTTYYLIPRPIKTTKYTFKTIIRKPEETTWEHEKLAMPALVNVVKDFNPDIIQVFGSENIYGLITKYISVPVVLHIQGILTTCLNTFLPPFVSWRMYLWQELSYKKTLKRISDRIAWRRNSITEQRMMHAIKYFMGHSIWDERVTRLFSPDSTYYYCSEMLRNTFYDSQESRILPSKPVFITTISPPLYKGYDLLLKTARELKKVMPDFEWKVFGYVNDKFIDKIFKISHKDVNVHLMGVASAEQIKDALLHATAYVHTSYIENACNSVCEAQILGVPCIVTYTGGIPSLIDDSHTGFLVPTNDPFQMTYLMKYLAENPDINMEIGENAKQTAMKRHDRKMIVERVMDIYTDILSKTKNK